MWNGGEPGDIRGALKSIFESILGRSCFMALTYHLRRTLKEDPLTAFLRRPRDFYEALASFFGESGAMLAFKIICGRLIILSGSEEHTPDEIYNLLMRDEDAARRIIIAIIEKLARGRGVMP